MKLLILPENIYSVYNHFNSTTSYFEVVKIVGDEDLTDIWFEAKTVFEKTYPSNPIWSTNVKQLIKNQLVMRLGHKDDLPEYYL